MWARMSAEDLALSWAAWKRGKEGDAERIATAKKNGELVAGAVIYGR